MTPQRAAGLIFQKLLFIFAVLGAGRSIGSYLFTRRISQHQYLSAAFEGQDPRRVDFAGRDWKTKISADFRLFIQVRACF